MLEDRAGASRESDTPDEDESEQKDELLSEVLALSSSDGSLCFENVGLLCVSIISSLSGSENLNFKI